MSIKSGLALALLAFGLLVADSREALADGIAVTVHNNTGASITLYFTSPQCLLSAHGKVRLCYYQRVGHGEAVSYTFSAQTSLRRVTSSCASTSTAPSSVMHIGRDGDCATYPGPPPAPPPPAPATPPPVIAVPTSPLAIGAEVALFHPTHQRYLRIDGNTANFVVNGSGQGTAASALPANWKWERFRVIDAGNGRVALYNQELQRFVRLSSTFDVDSTASADPYGLPASWNLERFEVKLQPDGRVALYQADLGRYLSMKSDHDVEGATTPMSFDVGVLTPPSLVPGSVVALFHQTEKCFVRIHGTTGRADCGGHKGTPAELPADWTWERFQVVDGGAGRVALYNTTTKRFLRMTPGSPPAGVPASELDSSERATAELPATWGWERFTVEERGLGVVALSNHTPRRYLAQPGPGPAFDLAAATTPGLYLVQVLPATPTAPLPERPTPVPVPAPVEPVY